jgi:hypothetical protein
MSTLFLLAPKSKNNPSSHQKDFHTIFNSGIGPDYGISQSQIAQIFVGMPVVLFDRDLQRQAVGTVVGYTPTDKKAGNGVQRYDVKISNFSPQQYNNPPRVNRFGVAIY